MTMLNPNWKKVQELQPSGQVGFHTQFDMVRMFYILAGLPTGVPGQVIAGTEIMKRINLIRAETLELLARLEEFKQNQNVETTTAVAKAVGDTAYVIISLAVTLGIPYDTLFALTHQANVGKVKDVAVLDDNDKVLKPLGWIAPPLQKLIEQAIQQFQAQQQPPAANEPVQ